MIENEKITVTDGMENMNFDSVTRMLTKAHWCEGIKKEEILKGASNSALVVGAFSGGEQVGYCRVISDKTRFAYIMDVIVDESCRKLGVGQMMINHMLAHKEFSDVYQWLLITRDAHGMYEKCGFQHTSRPDDWMEIRRPRPER